MEERNVDTKGKSPKQGLTNANDLPEERESPYYRLNWLTNLTYSLIYGTWGRNTASSNCNTTSSYNAANSSCNTDCSNWFQQ